MVDSWTKEGLPEWAEADIKKLKSKSEYKDMEEKQLLQAYALKLVESNWADDDDRNNYKNKNKQATHTGANIVAALIRTWVIAAVTADVFEINPKPTREEMENIYLESKDYFESLRAEKSPTKQTQICRKVKALYNSVSKIDTSTFKGLRQEEFKKVNDYFDQVEDISDVELNSEIESVISTAENIAGSVKGLKNSSKDIYALQRSDIYFNNKFRALLNKKYSLQQSEPDETLNI